MTKYQLPYGTEDLCPELHVTPGPPKRIRCFVKGCTQMLRPPTRRGGGDVCPDHGIRCHWSGTYSYADVRRNLIVDADLFATRVVGHPFKYESDRCNSENSEDALSWNVFRSLQKAGQLHKVARVISGIECSEEPVLYLWGLRTSNDSFEPWDLLMAARDRFERNLPVMRPLTEPDIALHLSGEYLILIEAKFTSPNPYYVDGPRQNAVSLTKSELLELYWDPSIKSLNREKAQAAPRVHYQLWRNLVFAEWMADFERNATPAYLASLTRHVQEDESCREFSTLLNPHRTAGFQHASWEQVIEEGCAEIPSLAALHKYSRSKTAKLRGAFQLKKIE
jgi:hypothetical protein